MTSLNGQSLVMQMHLKNQGFRWGFRGPKNLCVIECLSFALKNIRRRMLTPLTSKYIHAVDNWLQFEWFCVDNGAKTKDYQIGLHKHRDLIIQMQRNDIPMWIPGQYVAIYTSLAPILQSDHQLFQLSYTRQKLCDCGANIDRTSKNNLIGLNEEALLANSSLQTSIHEYFKQCEMINCELCGRAQLAPLKIQRYPDILVVNIDSGQIDEVNYTIEDLIQVKDSAYQLDSIVSLWGGITRALLKIDGSYHYYDSLQNNGLAQSIGISQYSDYTNEQFINNAHYYIVIKQQQPLEVIPQINSEFMSLWDVEESQNETVDNELTDFQSLFVHSNSRKEQLLDEKAIKAGLKTKQCCSNNCLQSISTQQVLTKRTKRARFNSEQSLVWLTDYVEEHIKSDVVHWQLNQQQICPKAFSFLHGYSLKKMYKARNFVLNKSMVPIGLNRLGIERGKKKLSVKVWITVYCQFFGDYRPDKKEIHLPCYMTNRQWYEQYLLEMELTGAHKSEIASLETFKLIRRQNFKHVKKPSTTRLGKCGTCTALKLRRLKCKTAQDIEQLKNQLREHTQEHVSERLPYHERKLSAVLHPTIYMSTIVDKTKDIWLPHLVPALKSSDMLQLLKIGLIGIKNHGLQLNEFSFFLSDHWELDADFHISILHDHLVRVIQSGHTSKILYIQADNSAAESKNKYFLYFCGVLVYLGLFEEVFYSTMIPGHTHEDIDQLFQAIHTYLARNSAMTFKDLMECVFKAYSNPPKCEIFKQAHAWKNWFQQFCNPISKHKTLHCFNIKRPSVEQVKTYKISNLPRLFVKSRSTDEHWDGGSEGLGYILFQQQPQGVPQCKLPKYNNLPDTEYQKFSNFMNEEQLQHWKQLSSSSGQNIIPKEPQKSIFDIAVNKPKMEEKVQKTTSNLLKTKKTQEVVQRSSRNIQSKKAKK